LLTTVTGKPRTAAGHEAVLGIGSVILPKRSICRVAGRLEIAGHGLTRFVAPHSGLRLCCLGRDHRRRLHDGQQRRVGARMGEKLSGLRA
jgi:hypothetical protein